MNIISTCNVIFRYFFLAVFSILFLTAKDSFSQVNNNLPQNSPINLTDTTGTDSTKQINAAYIQDSTMTHSLRSLIKIGAIILKIELIDDAEYSKSK